MYIRTVCVAGFIKNFVLPRFVKFNVFSFEHLQLFFFNTVSIEHDKSRSSMH